MLPLSLLKSAINHALLVELKNGESYNGHLANCDAWMNIYLTNVICTSRNGDRFWKLPECYIRGSTIKFLRISDEVIENFKEDSSQKMRENRSGGFSGGRGGGGGRGGSAGGNRGGRVGGGGGGRGGSAGNNRGGGGGGRSSLNSSNSSLNKSANKQQRK